VQLGDTDRIKHIVNEDASGHIVDINRGYLVDGNHLIPFTTKEARESMEAKMRDKRHICSEWTLPLQYPIECAALHGAETLAFLLGELGADPEVALDAGKGEPAKTLLEREAGKGGRCGREGLGRARRGGAMGR